MKRRGAPPSFDLVVDPELPATWPADGIGPIAELIAKLPEPSTLSPGSYVAVAEGNAPRSGISRLFRKAPKAHLAVRCAALLARGYTRIGGGIVDGKELAWGFIAE